MYIIKYKKTNNLGLKNYINIMGEVLKYGCNLLTHQLKDLFYMYVWRLHVYLTTGRIALLFPIERRKAARLL